MTTPAAAPRLSALRRGLAALHAAGAALAGLLLVAVALLTLVPVVLRLLHLPAHSWDEVATFCMAGASFLGLAWAWRAGVHVRMELLVTRLPGRAGRLMQALALAASLAICAYFTLHALRFVRESYTMNDLSQGLLPIPLWIPQTPMVLGLLLLCLAMGESLVATLRGAPVAGAEPAATPSALDRAAGEL